MSTRRGKAPSYRHHVPSGRAFVQYKRRAIYLGKHRSPESVEAYNRFLILWQTHLAEGLITARTLRGSDFQSAQAFERLLSQWAAGADSGELKAPLATKDDLTIFELVDRYWRYAETYYRRHDPYAADGGARVPTGTAANQKPALRRLNQIYGSTKAAKFGPLALKALRKTWVDERLSIKTANSYTAIITGVFQWATSEQLVAVEVYQALKSVRGLERGRSEAHEPEPVGPVADTVVKATLPHLPAVVADMVKFQRLTGCRPTEVCTIRPADVQRWTMIADEPLPLFDGADRQARPRELDVWEYRPAHHKTKHRDRQRIIPIGPRAQEILRPYLLPLAFTPEVFCFRPPECNRQRAARRYAKDTYARAISRACELLYKMPEELRKLEWKTTSKTSNGRRSGRVSEERRAELRLEAAAWRAKHCWSPNQLRHTAATAIRQQYGLEASQVVLGHATADVTQIYAAADWGQGGPNRAGGWIAARLRAMSERRYIFEELKDGGDKYASYGRAHGRKRAIAISKIDAGREADAPGSAGSGGRVWRRAAD
jgi:integrase